MPTLRQKKAFKKAAENGGVVSRAMLDAGYSAMTAQDPKKLTDSKGWKELMEIYLPDDKLGRKHDQLLNDQESNVQVKALDMAYKLKGKYAPEKALNLNMNLEDPELAEEVRQLSEKFNDFISEHS